MEAVVDEFGQYSYGDGQEEYVKRIKEAVGRIDTDSCLEIISEWESRL